MMFTEAEEVQPMESANRCGKDQCIYKDIHEWKEGLNK